MHKNPVIIECDHRVFIIKTTELDSSRLPV